MAVFRTLSYKKLWILGSSTQSIGALLLAAVGVVYFLGLPVIQIEKSGHD